MCRFFKGTTYNNETISSKLMPINTHIGQFKLANHSNQLGKLVKVSLSDKELTKGTAFDYLNDHVIKAHKSSIFLWTVPTTFVRGELGTMVQPGHNFSAITNKEGEIECSISKTPDVKKILGERKRIPDERLKDQPQTFRVYGPRFTSIPEEINKWEQKAMEKSEYSLYIHILPLGPELSLSANSYIQNVQDLLMMQDPYTLYSSKHPYYDTYIPGNNCNYATAKSIFGLNGFLEMIQEQYCQEAVINIVSTILGNHLKDYLNIAQDMGLMDGIEVSPNAKENYYNAFTC